MESLSVPYEYPIDSLSVDLPTKTETETKTQTDTETETTDREVLFCETHFKVQSNMANKEALEQANLAGLSKPTLSLKEASFKAKKSEDTITRWAKKYGIGKQLHKGASWRIDPVGLAIVLEGDADALAAFQSERARR